MIFLSKAIACNKKIMQTPLIVCQSLREREREREREICLVLYYIIVLSLLFIKLYSFVLFMMLLLYRC
jgi:predicted nucleic acid-binding Zn ribbon protein